MLRVFADRFPLSERFELAGLGTSTVAVLSERFDLVGVGASTVAALSVAGASADARGVRFWLLGIRVRL